MPAAAHLRRLSETLDGPVTLGELAGRLGREGVGLLVLLLGVPFLQPVPLAGLGTPIGLLLMAVGGSLALGRRDVPLPAFAARRRLEEETVRRLLSGAERALGWIERVARPRRRGAHSPRAAGVAIAACGFLLAVPIFVPFGNPANGAALVLLGLGLLEDDGVLAALGLAAAAGALLFHAEFLRLAWHEALRLRRP
jgi:hypothetical protein